MDDSDFLSLKMFLLQTKLTYREAREALAKAITEKDVREKALKDYEASLTVKPVKPYEFPPDEIK